MPKMRLAPCQLPKAKVMTYDFEKLAARYRADKFRRLIPPVSLPVDVTDAEQFPNIAAAVEWARDQEQLQAEWDANND